jgi:hypothetical protein
MAGCGICRAFNTAPFCYVPRPGPATNSCLVLPLCPIIRCSIFNMFDTTLLLGSNGNVVYSGPQRLALSYMAFLGFRSPPNENLADFLLDVTAGGSQGLALLSALASFCSSHRAAYTVSYCQPAPTAVIPCRPNFQSLIILHPSLCERNTRATSPLAY